MQEIAQLQSRQNVAELGRLDCDDFLEDVERNVLTNDGCRLQEPLVFRRQPIDARRQHGLDRWCDVDVGHRLFDAVCARSDCTGLDKRPNALLQEERIAGGSDRQSFLQRHERRVGAEKVIQEFSR